MSAECDSSPVIQVAVPCDADRLLPLVVAFFAEDGIITPPLMSNVAAMLQDERARVLVAVQGRDVLGFASATCSRGLEFGISVEIEDLYVVPAARGQGLSKQLFQSLLSWGEELGAQDFALVVTPEAQADQDLLTYYQQWGFADSRRHLLYRSKG